VQRRQNFHGLNELASDEKEPLWKRFVDKLKEPMILMLGASAAVSPFMKQFDDAISILAVGVAEELRPACFYSSTILRTHTPAHLPDHRQSVAIVISVVVAEEYKSDQSLEALSKLAPTLSRPARRRYLRDGRRVPCAWGRGRPLSG